MEEKRHEPLVGYHLLISDVLKASKNKNWEKIEDLPVYGTMEEPLFPVNKIKKDNKNAKYELQNMSLEGDFRR
jgi:hypothetical protein